MKGLYSTVNDCHTSKKRGIEPLRYPPNERRWFRCPTHPKAVHRLGFQSQRPNSFISNATLHCGHLIPLLKTVSSLRINVFRSHKITIFILCTGEDRNAMKNIQLSLRHLKNPKSGLSGNPTIAALSRKQLKHSQDVSGSSVQS